MRTSESSKCDDATVVRAHQLSIRSVVAQAPRNNMKARSVVEPFTEAQNRMCMRDLLEVGMSGLPFSIVAPSCVPLWAMLASTIEYTICFTMRLFDGPVIMLRNAQVH